METHDALEAARQRHPVALPAGSDAEKDALGRFAHFFGDFEPDRVERMLQATYSPDVWFNDSLKTVHGSADLGRYLEESAAGVEDCKVTIEEITRTSHGEYLVRWKMLIRFRKFARGRDTWTIGVTHLRFTAEGLVTYHQDYWDSARGVFEHIPLLGAGIRAIRRRV